MPVKPSTVLARKREEDALRLRARGERYSAIGEHLGVTEHAAAAAVKRALSRSAEATKELGEEIRELELERLDRLQDQLWPRAIGGDLRAVDRILNISVHRARLLGLYAPVKHEVTGKDGGPVEIDVAAGRELLLGRLASIHDRFGQDGSTSPNGSNGHRALPPAT